MKKIQFNVIPSIPKELEGLKELSENLYWSWNPDIRHLFRRLDRTLWDKVQGNPVAMLGSVSQDRLEMRSKDEAYLSHLARSQDALKKYLKQSTWYNQNHKSKKLSIAYFSMEYGLSNALPIYSGGLGVLAGDHLKSASDLGLPFVAVGLFYQEGYFHQYLSSDGWQQETYPRNDFFNMPARIVRDANNDPIHVAVDFPGRQILAQIWLINVGRINLYLLDTNIEQNAPLDRELTDRLYAGDSEKRIQQEILLGIGGIKALKAIDIYPHVCHMNEGHSAFLALERCRLLMEERELNFDQAREATRGGNVFTSHTPVPAGIDEFDASMVDTYLRPYYESMNISQNEFHRLGGTHLPQTRGQFNMAIFAINMAGFYNGVSRLHGKVARDMWHYLWPQVPVHQVPIGHVTNGVHLPSWVSENLAELCNQYLGPRWIQEPTDPRVWARVDSIPDEELWRAHERSRERLVSFARNRLERQLVNSGGTLLDIDRANEVLNPKALTIGFARRFAQYKRAFLIFKDLNRLKRILNHPDYPVQMIFSGKAHPRDNIGKGIIRDIISTIRHSELRNKIVFLEDYDMEIGNHMVSGVDVWLNNPRRPREASGTSGMKAGANGALNLSILDGWWDEAYQNDRGWAIGRGEVYENHEEQDRVESEAIYFLLENEVIPCFYDRGKSDVPRRWLSLMKKSIQNTALQFNTNRMVKEYFERFYLSSFERWNHLTADNFKAAQQLVKWKTKVEKNWDKIHILSVNANTQKDIKVGEELLVTAVLDIDGLTPDDLCVQVYSGPLDSKGDIEHGQTHDMKVVSTKDKTITYQTSLITRNSGQYGFAVRVLPFHQNLTDPFELGLLKWFKESA